jgi:hypothetical protein
MRRCADWHRSARGVIVSCASPRPTVGPDAVNAIPAKSREFAKRIEKLHRNLRAQPSAPIAQIPEMVGIPRASPPSALAVNRKITGFPAFQSAATW